VTYKLAIFDFDGTLADTLPWFLRTVNRMAETHGFNRIEAGDIETLRTRRELTFTFRLRCRSVTTWPTTKPMPPG
jgi:phosphoglycolate phosphatase-like HAD superfamily hydrolase